MRVPMDETIGIYGGDEIGSAPSRTGRIRNARYNKIIEAIGGAGYHVTDTPSLTKALIDALAAGKPALINCVIDPMAGREEGCS
jgi:oxalyl-CoA decarboxylase